MKFKWKKYDVRKYIKIKLIRNKVAVGRNFFIIILLILLATLEGKFSQKRWFFGCKKVRNLLNLSFAFYLKIFGLKNCVEICNNNFSDNIWISWHTGWKYCKVCHEFQILYVKLIVAF